MVALNAAASSVCATADQLAQRVGNSPPGRRIAFLLALQNAHSPGLTASQLLANVIQKGSDA